MGLLKRTGPAVLTLLFLNLYVFLFQLLSGPHLGLVGPDGFYPIGYYLALIPDLMFYDGYVWQLVTYQFVHGSIRHITFNMIFLWMFGMPVENELGTVHCLLVYVVSGIVGGFLGLIYDWGFLENQMMLLGASGGVWGLMGVLAALSPDRSILAFGLFRTRLWRWAVLLGAFSVFALMSDLRGQVGHPGHLGGLVVGAGWVWMLRWHQEDLRLSVLREDLPWT